MSWQICCAVFRTGTWSLEKMASLWTRQTHWPSWLPISLPSPTSDNWESKALPGVWPQAQPSTGMTNPNTLLTTSTLSSRGWWGLLLSHHLNHSPQTPAAAQSLERDDTLSRDSPTMNKTEITYAQLPHTHLLTAYKYCRLCKTRAEQEAPSDWMWSQLKSSPLTLLPALHCTEALAKTLLNRDLPLNTMREPGKINFRFYINTVL